VNNIAEEIASRGHGYAPCGFVREEAASEEAGALRLAVSHRFHR
jgi:hypothetical protein